MKTTVDLADSLLLRAKKLAKKRGRPLRELLEEGLRRVLEDEGRQGGYDLEDHSVGDPCAKNPLEDRSWPDLRDEIYGGH